MIRFKKMCAAAVAAMSLSSAWLLEGVRLKPVYLASVINYLPDMPSMVNLRMVNKRCETAFGMLRINPFFCRTGKELSQTLALCPYLNTLRVWLDFSGASNAYMLGVRKTEDEHKAELDKLKDELNELRASLVKVVYVKNA